jgi:NitT/TauT family transport system permease protein
MTRLAALLLSVVGGQRIRQSIGTRAKVGWGIAGIVVIVLLYSYLSYRQHQINPEDTTIPNFSQLLEGLKKVLTPPDNSINFLLGSKEEVPQNFLAHFVYQVRHTWLWQDATATYGRLLKGLVWGCLLSVVLGVLMGCYASVAALFLPPLSFLSKVPGTAILAVFFVMAGTGETMFISMIGFGVVPTLTQTVYLAARDDLHPEEINKAYTLGATNLAVIWNVVFQQILPKMLDSIRLQIGLAMVYLIAAEMLVGDVGMGYRIRMQQKLLHMNVVYNYIILLGLTGMLMDYGLIRLRQWLCPWFEK